MLQSLISSFSYLFILFYLLLSLTLDDPLQQRDGPLQFHNLLGKDSHGILHYLLGRDGAGRLYSEEKFVARMDQLHGEWVLSINPFVSDRVYKVYRVVERGWGRGTVRCEVGSR